MPTKRGNVSGIHFLLKIQKSRLTQSTFSYALYLIEKRFRLDHEVTNPQEQKDMQSPKENPEMQQDIKHDAGFTLLRLWSLLPSLAFW